MYTFIAFTAVASVVWLIYVWKNRKQGFTNRIIAVLGPIAMVSAVSAVITTFALMALAPLKEVEVWTTDIEGFRTENAMTKFLFVDGRIKSAGEATYEFSYETTAGQWRNVRVLAGKDTRVVEDDTLDCDEVKWKFSRVVVDDDWFFSGWLFSRDTMRVTHEFRVAPKVAYGETDSVN